MPTQVVEIDGVYYAVINSLTNSVYTLIYNPLEFDDVEGHWAKDAVNDMASRKVINGYTDRTFNPDEDIIRAEFAAIVVRALGLAEGMGENSFSDVEKDDWYCGYVETAASYGIINGYGNGEFGPNDLITREQAMTMLARAMKITELETDLSNSTISTLLVAYTDSEGVSDYAQAGVVSCIQTGVVTGKTPVTIAPQDSVTRAEVAVTVQRLLEKSELI